MINNNTLKHIYYTVIVVAVMAITVLVGNYLFYRNPILMGGLYGVLLYPYLEMIKKKIFNPMPHLTPKQQEQLIDNYREFADNIKNIDPKLSDYAFVAKWKKGISSTKGIS